MQLGSFEVPEIRLVPNAIADTKIIYDNVQTEPTKSKDLASFLGYSNATASRFYLRLKAMVSYGLLEGRGSYKVSERGKALAYPEENQDKDRTDAVLNVGLWNELYKKFKHDTPKENFWIHLKNISGIEPKHAQEIQSIILKWYLEDIAYVTEYNENTGQEQGKEHLTSRSTQGNQMSQQVEVPQTSSLGQLTVPNMGTIQINDNDTLTIARTYLDVLEKKMKEPKKELEKVKNIEDEPEPIEE